MWLSCVLMTAVIAVGADEQREKEAATAILPRPRIEKAGEGAVTLAAKGGSVTVAFRGGENGQPFREGLDLLSRRVKVLGGAGAEVAEDARVVVERCDADAFRALLKKHGVTEALESDRLEQAYALSAADGGVTIRAVGDLGCFYGLVSLVQLIEAADDGGIRAPAVEIVDWPEIARRLSKASATSSRLAGLRRAAEWLPLYKFSFMALQYHGKRSKDPEPPFPENVRTICGEVRRRGVLRTIVYFCPFKGRGYDLTQPDDRTAYTDQLLKFMAQGADGVEIDYNDWPGKIDVPMQEVLTFACVAVREKHPEAIVLWCPPVLGPVSYRRMATPQLKAVLDASPKAVMPLWTGMATLITRPLTARTLEQWTQKAGRRPFLWVNRASLTQAKTFGRKVKGMPGVIVFRGDFLPETLHDLVEGVHLNSSFGSGKDLTSGTFAPANLVFLATAADFLWNPHGWTPAGSARRAGRFVEIMAPLVAQRDPGTPSGRAPSPESTGKL